MAALLSLLSGVAGDGWCRPGQQCGLSPSVSPSLCGAVTLDTPAVTAAPPQTLIVIPCQNSPDLGSDNTHHRGSQ